MLACQIYREKDKSYRDESAEEISRRLKLERTEKRNNRIRELQKYGKPVNVPEIERRILKEEREDTSKGLSGAVGFLVATYTVVPAVLFLGPLVGIALTAKATYLSYKSTRLLTK